MNTAVHVAGGTRRLLIRNTLYLSISQVLALPLSVFTTAIAARYLGAEAFGHAYLAFTLCGFGFLAVGWGHEAVLPALVARDRRLAGEMLGSSLAYRVCAGVLVYAGLAGYCAWMGYPPELQWALGLSATFMLFTYLVAACKDTIRGLERADIPAYAHAGNQLLAAIFVFAVLTAGGKLRAAIAAQAAAAMVVLIAIWPTLRPIGVGALTVRWNAVKTLFIAGGPFVLVNLALALQPNIDAFFLANLAPVEVMGWYAASYRLVGTLLLPATTMIGALYPTLCRLYATDREDFTRTANATLRGVSLLAVPVSLACGLFPQVGVSLYSRESFGPAEDNLRIMAFLIFPVYFSMPLGTCILAAGRQRAWSMVQFGCVIGSLLLDPWLVPYFQQRFGNGGLGVCLTGAICEVFMISAGIALAPPGVFDARLRRYILLTLVAGAAMAGTAYVAHALPVLVAAALSFAAYGLVLWMTGALEGEHLNNLRGALARKFAPRSA
jgi:O-antigen/teichoic acid export membrane protein